MEKKIYVLAYSGYKNKENKEKDKEKMSD